VCIDLGNCPQCGDKVIHQGNRGANESSSALGQFVHDALPRAFHFADIDGVVFKKWTKVYRKIEHKPLDGKVSGSQRDILPIEAIALDAVKVAENLHPQSGTFVLWTNGDFTSGKVTRVKPTRPFETGPVIDLDRPMLSKFLSGEVME
jgi:hypothetical protein